MASTSRRASCMTCKAHVLINTNRICYVSHDVTQKPSCCLSEMQQQSTLHSFRGGFGADSVKDLPEGKLALRRVPYCKKDMQSKAYARVIYDINWSNPRSVTVSVFTESA